jgi:phospholipase/lecithinase/hemolysin
MARFPGGCAAVVLLLAAGGAHAASPPVYPAIYAFGDSLTDSGNGYINSGRTTPVSPPYARGRWSNGPTWVEYLAHLLAMPPIRPSLEGGDNFAFGGACSGPSAVHQEAIIDLPTQLADFTLQELAPVPGALYTLDIGGNDLTAIFSTPGITNAEAQADIGQVVANVTLFLDNLIAAGMQNLLLVTAPDQTLQPASNKDPPADLQAILNLDTQYNTALVNAVTVLAAAHGVKLTVLQLAPLMEQYVAAPASYGLTDVIDPCYTGSTTIDNGTLCAATRFGQDKYMFWDALHPTTGVHSLLAQQAQSLLGVAAPSGQ